MMMINTKTLNRRRLTAQYFKWLFYMGVYRRTLTIICVYNFLLRNQIYKNEKEEEGSIITNHLIYWINYKKFGQLNKQVDYLASSNYCDLAA